MTPGAQLAALGGLAVVLIGAGVAGVRRAAERTPEKRERKRRAQVHRSGRLGDAFITEADQDTLYYEYSVRGVHYAASQDIRTLRHCLPGAPERLIGHASIKYSQHNPANSILVCEDWSGLRRPPEA